MTTRLSTHVIDIRKNTICQDEPPVVRAHRVMAASGDIQTIVANAIVRPCHRELGHGEGCIVEYALHAFQSCVAVPPDSEVINAPDAQRFGLPPLTESINALADDSEPCEI